MPDGRELTIARLQAGGIYCLTAEKFSLGRSNIEVVERMLSAGITIVQYREKTKKMGEKLEECRIIRQLTKNYDAALVINDDVDLALLVKADCVHVGQEDLPVSAVRSLVGESMAIGLSTHDPDQAREAVEAGADYIGVGPVFATATKEDVCAPVGLGYVKWVAENLDIPFTAIGGIKEHNLRQVVEHGARSVAMVTEVVEAEDIPARIAALNKAMEG